MNLKLLAAPSIAALMACSTGDEHTNIEPDSVWVVTVNGVSHASLNMLMIAADSPKPSLESDEICQFEITGSDVLWLEARYGAEVRKTRKPDYADMLGWFVAVDRSSDNYIASSGSMFRTSKGRWHEIPETRWDELDRYVRQKEKEAGCRAM